MAITHDDVQRALDLTTRKAEHAMQSMSDVFDDLRTIVMMVGDIAIRLSVVERRLEAMENELEQRERS